MESFESILELEWSSLNAMNSTEESDFMAQLLNYGSNPNELHVGSNFTIPSNNTNHVSLGNNHDSYYAGDFNHIFATNDDFSICNEKAKGEKTSLVQLLSNADAHENIIMQLEQDDEVPDPEFHNEAGLKNPPRKSKKRYTNSVQKNRRNVKAKKNQKLTKTCCTNNKDKNAALQKQSLSSCSSENDSIASHELNGVASNSSDSKKVTTVNSNGQVRAVRGSATDPQSLYARKRRERINERLRTLQNLVPNGTKVDISTMLEDAVQYVKFLQLQIKLLSSDDKWMYAPIAYNGTDVRT